MTEREIGSLPSSTSPPQVSGQPGLEEQRAGAPPPRRRLGAGLLLVVVLGIAVLVGGALAVLAVRHRDAQSALATTGIRVSGLPADVPTALANVMSLSAIPGKPAAGFNLVDQHGQAISLRSLRGRVVVLEFMDPHCTDICPIVSQEFVDAYHDLGRTASRVAFVAVNVNQYFRSPAVVARFSDEHGLNAIPSWRFVTGSVAALKAVWRDYGIAVGAPHPNADIVHSSFVFFIGPNGKERYLASPVDDHTPSGTSYLPPGQISSWGHGIALVARDLAG